MPSSVLYDNGGERSNVADPTAPFMTLATVVVTSKTISTPLGAYCTVKSNASTPLSPQQGGARLESLTEVIKRDLSKPAELGQQQVGPRERARRLLGEEEDGY